MTAQPEQLPGREACFAARRAVRFVGALLAALLCLPAALAYDAGGALTGDVLALPDGTPVEARPLLPEALTVTYPGRVEGGRVTLNLPEALDLRGYSEQRPAWYCPGQVTDGLETLLVNLTVRPPSGPSLPLNRTVTLSDGTQILDVYLYANRDGTVLRNCRDGTLERLQLSRGWNTVRFTFYAHGTLVTNAPARLLPYAVRAVQVAPAD